jgi:hypothetical protein
LILSEPGFLPLAGKQRRPSEAERKRLVTFEGKELKIKPGETEDE